MVAATFEALFRRERVLIGDHLGGGTRLPHEKIKRAGIEPDHPVGRLALDQAQRLDAAHDHEAD
jgi:hypothetical protein